MKNYVMVELKNDERFVIVDTLDYDNKKYFLLARVLNEVDVDNEFEIYYYNGETNSFDELENELEYNYVKDLFSNRLNELGKRIEIEDNNVSNIIKLRVVDIKDYYYTFEKVTGEIINMDIEVFGNFKIQVNDNVYMLEDTTKETITVRFGTVISDETEIIKIIRGEESYYLQRYYG